MQNALAERHASRSAAPDSFANFLAGDVVIPYPGAVPTARADGRGWWSRGWKRAFDVAVASLLLLALAPLFVVVAVLIKLDSPGPVFYRQERVGRWCRRFQMVKFRSMHRHADSQVRALGPMNEADGPLFKIRRDPRVTRVGRVLRRYSLDELPQLLNVLAGDMSLIGPRPPLMHEVARYTLEQRRRLSVTPGLTGLWQVSGRSDLPFIHGVALDLFYVEHCSLALDLMILALTIPAVLRSRGAY